MVVLWCGARSWWFTIGFVGVGITTNFGAMFAKLRGGHAVGVYMLGQAFDLVLTYAAAYLCFGVLYDGQFD